MEKLETSSLGPRRTADVLTKYEFTRAVGLLALQISKHIDASAGDGATALEAAERLVRERKVSLVIRRYLPDGTHEDCPLERLRVEEATLPA